MKKQLGVAVAVLGLLAACGAPWNDLDGPVKGIGMTPSGTAFWVDGNRLYVYMSSSPDACANLKANITGKSSSLISMTLVAQGGASLTPATYRVTTAQGEQRVATVQFDHVNDTCQSAIGGTAQATAGTISLSRLEAREDGQVQGTFDLSFDSDRVTGRFRGTYCDLSSRPSTNTCQ
ncbi:MAG TPA: hypothetical protein VK447_13085 [Myxococcaceae bacterium]|nr:hypothetical protein [Myxococcaceae bacterium]